MKEYEYLKTVGPSDIDALNHVNNVRYVQWIQDAAEAHWNTLATGEMKENYIWMVLSHHIEYKGQAFLGDEVRIRTYVTRSEGVTSTRVVEIYLHKQDKLLVTATTDWCLLSAATKRPARIGRELAELFE